MKRKLHLSIVLALIISSINTYSQIYSDFDFDSTRIASEEYNYILPILGEKTHDLGFDLPRPLGLSVNYIWQQSNILISDVSIGFNNSELINVDELINFNETTSSTHGLSFRPDVWILPFLNIYGILATANSQTFVDVSVGIPNIDGGFDELFNIQTNVDVPTTTFGFGLTPTVGVLGGWIALDMNMTWTNVETLDENVFTFILDPRIGKTFNFKKPERNISVWVGAFGLNINRNTSGNIAFNEVMDADKWHEKINTGQNKVGEAQIELDDWWGDLTPIEQNNPVNIARKEGNQKKLDVAGVVLVAAENAVENAENSTIKYELDKRPASIWNFTLGSQFQINKRWMIRLEYGGLSNRKHVIGGLQYRFGLGKGKS